MNHEPETTMNQAIGCQANLGGTECRHAVTLTEPVRLCDEHKLLVAAAVLPELVATALRDARQLNGRVLPADAAYVVASAAAAPMPTTDPHPALVYFMANGGRVKIGYTKSLFARVSSLSLREDAILLLLHGGLNLERALHAKFGAHRVADSEWFELAPDVVHFIAGKAPQHRVGRTPRPIRQKTSKQAHKGTRSEQRGVALAAIRSLFAALGRRPTETEMVAELTRMKARYASAAHAKNLRAEIEREDPGLAALGTDNVRPLTG